MKKLRTLGGTDMATKGFSVPYEIREEMNLKEGDMLKIRLQKSESDEKGGIRDKQEVMEVLRTASVHHTEEIIEISQREIGLAPGLSIPSMEYDRLDEEMVATGFLRTLGNCGLEERSDLKERVNEVEKRIDNHYQKRREWDDQVTDRAKYDRKRGWEWERDKLLGSLIAVKWLLGEDQPEISRIEKIEEEEE